MCGDPTTIDDMHLIIPGSLPPANVAKDLASYVEQHCQPFIKRMCQLTAEEIRCPPEETGCTALEYLQLSALGYAGQPGQSFGAGLGPFRAGITSGEEAVWIADLCAITIGRENATLTPPELLELSQTEADALYETVRPLWEGLGISALPIGLGRWRIWLPNNVSHHSISPAAVSALSVSDLWPQEDSLKTWRKLLNEIQMVWHTHPVNVQRSQQGRDPVNSLWLYGGASGWKPENPKEESIYLDTLYKNYLAEDWASWIENLKSLSDQLSHLPDSMTMTLVGNHRTVRLSPPHKQWWQSLWPRRKQNWIAWWIPQN